LHNRASIHAVTDLSDGGLALAAFEMADAAGLGITLTTASIPRLFGEDQARYLVACTEEQATTLEAYARQFGPGSVCVGRFGGDAVIFGTDTARLADLSALYRGAFAAAIGE
jgi:phosphoribosylformylglycinamidine synthase subunit PurL